MLVGALFTRKTPSGEQDRWARIAGLTADAGTNGLVSNALIIND